MHNDYVTLGFEDDLHNSSVLGMDLDSYEEGQTDAPFRRLRGELSPPSPGFLDFIL